MFLFIYPEYYGKDIFKYLARLHTHTNLFLTEGLMVAISEKNCPRVEWNSKTKHRKKTYILLGRKTEIILRPDPEVLCKLLIDGKKNSEHE